MHSIQEDMQEFRGQLEKGSISSLISSSGQMDPLFLQGRFVFSICVYAFSESFP